jgi:hypothetical protein
MGTGMAVKGRNERNEGRRCKWRKVIITGDRKGEGRIEVRAD